MSTIETQIHNDDISKCAKLYVEVFNAKPWNDNWTTETAFKRLNDIYIAPNFVGIKYVEENDIKGAIFGNWEQFFNCIHYNLKEMFVSTDLQGTGIGSKLLNALEEQLKVLDIGTIYLFTSKGNKTSKFYQKNNFVEWESMAMMGKDI
jgi:GNAT superfamily N-acetyltransferase